MVAIEIDRNEAGGRRFRCHPVRAHFDLGAHLGQRLGKFHITLDRIPADASNPHRAAAYRAQRKEIGSRRSIAFDINSAG